ncbi:unnamed protein product [Linum tenue]|uniref:DNA-directed RNA polymerase III subunit RPC4 n=1 Tax=Linum tenue TaxID=586396 RepID=A0AAV0H152_9ROSI|nr:unnamed protein product [Linum tenue]
MDHDDPPANRRKLKFAPSPLPRGSPASPPPNPRQATMAATNEAAKAQKLMTRFNENLKRQATIADTKLLQLKWHLVLEPHRRYRLGIWFTLRRRLAMSGISSGWDSDPDAMQIDGKDEGAGHGAIDLNRATNQKKYKEPFDYESYYPITLPLRQPFSGDPGCSERGRVGKDAMNEEYDENFIKHASELGLLEKSDEAKMLLFKFPPKMPYINRSIISAKGKKGLEAGIHGQMVVYKSGAVKLKIGDVLYDVAQGSDCTFHQQVMAVTRRQNSVVKLGRLKNMLSCLSTLILFWIL